MPKSKSQQTKTVKELTLTARELEVLRLVANGKSSKSIARELFISSNTIEAHRKQILKKMEAKNIAAAISTAFRNKIIH